MIVFLNMKDHCLDIYTDTGCRHCSFSETETIKQLIGNERVIYVTKAIETTKKDVLDIVGSLAKTMTKKMLRQDNGKSYIRSTSKGYMHIADIDITFKGPAHFISIDDLFEKYGKDVLQKPNIDKLLRKGKLQIITESEINKITQQNLAEQQKRQAMKDQSLDDILVDGPVDSYLSGSDGGVDGHYDAIEIDVKGTGGGSGNEGNLLPDDFA
jgi:hypothetical protein